MFEKEKLLARSEQIGNYIVTNNATVRQAAEEFGVSKTTVHDDINKRLKLYNNELYKKVREVVNYNISQRAIRGGVAKGKKYKK